MRWTSLFLAAAIAGGVGWWLSVGAEREAATASVEVAAPADGAATPAERVIAVRVLASAARPMAETLTLRGATEADRKVEVKAETAGRVVSERRVKGEVVAGGDLLCRIAPGERPARLAEAKAAQTRREIAARASERLSRRGYSAETTRAADAAELEAAKAMVAQMEIDIARTEITAPFAGRLETDTADLGDLMMPGETCATVVALDPIRIVAFAPERVVDAIKPGTTATARLATGERIEAEITFVARSADAETRTFRVEATAPNPEDRIRDGLTAELTTGLETEAAHLLPASALTLDGAGRLGVRLAAPGDEGGHVARFAPVTVLRDATEGVWVTGLDASADVIVLGQEFVTDGAAIAPVWVETEDGDAA